MTSKLRISREVWAALGSVLVIVVGVFMFVDFSEPAEQSFYPVDVGPSEFASVEVGEPAPAFAVPTLDGSVFELGEVAGQPVWINVWASWCPPCRSEMPDVDQVRLAEADNGLVFLAMNFDEPLQAITNYLRNTGYDFQIGLDPGGEFMQKYNVQGLPMHVFITADGRVESIRVGGMTRDEMEQTAQRLTSSVASASAPVVTVAAP